MRITKDDIHPKTKEKEKVMKKSMVGSLAVMVVTMMVMFSGVSWGQNIIKSSKITFKSSYCENLNMSKNNFTINAEIISDSNLMYFMMGDSDISISMGQWGTELVIQNADVLRITEKQGYAKFKIDGGNVIIKWNSAMMTIAVNYSSSIYGDNVVNLMGKKGNVIGTTPVTIEIYEPGTIQYISKHTIAAFTGKANITGWYDFQRWNVKGI